MPKHAAARQPNTEPAPKKQPYYVHNSLVSYYLLLMFSFFTLFLTNRFANARHDKFYLFLGLSGALIIGASVSYLLACTDKGIVTPLPPLMRPLSAADGAFLCFLIFAAVSAFASPYFPQTIIADVGRNNGLLLLVFYALVFYIITRMYVYKDYVIAVYLVFSSAVAVLTVINFFYIDPLGIFEGYSEDVIADFGATIGNKNTIASFMALFLPVAVMTLVLSDKRYMRIIAGISVGFAYMGALAANSSSVFLGLIVAVPVTAIFSARRHDRLMRFMLAMTILFAGGKLLRLFSLIMGEHSKGFEFIQNFLIYDKLAYIPIAVFGLLTLALYLLRGRLEPHYPAKGVMVTLTVLTALMIAGALFAILYFSVIDTATPLGNAERLLRFNDRWGTHRGFMWMRATDEYGKFNWFQKLFGVGPDMAYYVMEPHFDDLLKYGDSSTNCVHNEYLNYLITQGALGLLSYLALVGSVIVRAVRRAKQNPTALIFISAVICYAVQGVVNLYSPITTPIFFLFLAMAEALNRQTPLTNQSQRAA